MNFYKGLQPLAQQAVDFGQDVLDRFVDENTEGEALLLSVMEQSCASIALMRNLYEYDMNPEIMQSLKYHFSLVTSAYLDVLRGRNGPQRAATGRNGPQRRLSHLFRRAVQNR